MTLSKEEAVTAVLASSLSAHHRRLGQPLLLGDDAVNSKQRLDPDGTLTLSIQNRHTLEWTDYQFFQGEEVEVCGQTMIVVGGGFANGTISMSLHPKLSPLKARGYYL